jgi:hypothetical protein
MKIRMGTISGSSLIKAVGFSGAAGDNVTLRIQSVMPWSTTPGSPLEFSNLVRSKNPSNFYLRNIYARP